jgi:hypothetical protein
MARKDEDDIIADLVAAGVLLLLGYGLYRWVRSTFAFEEGQVVDEKSIIQAISDKREPNVCTKCGTTDPEKCNKGFARWRGGWSHPARAAGVPSGASLRVFSASPGTHRRLSPDLRGGILQAPWPNACVAADAMDRHRFSNPSCPAGLILFRWASL